MPAYSRLGGRPTHLWHHYGVSLLTRELTGKRLALLKETFPKIARVAVLSNPANPNIAHQLKDTRDGASALGLRLHVLEVQDSLGFDQAFSILTRERAGGLFVFSDPMFFEQREKIVNWPREPGCRRSTSSATSST
jgi:putative ABC transport system substrate-binding protein